MMRICRVLNGLEHKSGEIQRAPEDTLDDLSLEEDEVFDDSIKPDGLVDVVGADDDF